MRFRLLFITFFGFLTFLQPPLLFGKEMSLKDFFELALKNNLELTAYKKEVLATKLERDAARGALYPRLKLEEYFYRSDIPAQVFTFKLNQ